jgi:hypothetical protein
VDVGSWLEQEVTASQSQVSVRMGRPFVDGNRVAAEFWTTMLVDGAETTLPGCLLLEFGDDGRCRSLREYWHFEGGLLEPCPSGERELGATPAEVGIVDGMDEDRAYVAENTRERERLRALVERLTDDELSLPLNEYWAVAAIFGHIAFWDARVLSLADKLERADPFTSSDTEPEDVDWINDASRPLIHAIPPREVARLALRIAEETDARAASLPVDRLWPRDPDSPLYAVRASHRGEHLDDVEAALGGRST